MITPEAALVLAVNLRLQLSLTGTPGSAGRRLVASSEGTVPNFKSSILAHTVKSQGFMEISDCILSLRKNACVCTQFADLLFLVNAAEGK